MRQRFPLPSRRLLLGGGLIVAILIVWELYSRAGEHNRLYYSSPTEAVTTLALLAADPSFWTVHVRATAEGFVAGFVAATVLGVVLGTLMAWYRTLGETLEPFMFALNSVPRLAVIPVLMVWLSYGFAYKVVVVALATFFPVLLNAMEGVRGASPSLLRMARSFGASDREILTSVALPAATPLIFAGIRQALTHAVTGIIGAELWASAAGLGWIIANAAMTIQVERIIAAVVVVAVTGVVANEGIERLERHLTKWRQEAHR